MSDKPEWELSRTILCRAADFLVLAVGASILDMTSEGFVPRERLRHVGCRDSPSKHRCSMFRWIQQPLLPYALSQLTFPAPTLLRTAVMISNLGGMQGHPAPTGTVGVVIACSHGSPHSIICHDLGPWVAQAPGGEGIASTKVVPPSHQAH